MKERTFIPASIADTSSTSFRKKKRKKEKYEHPVTGEAKQKHGVTVTLSVFKGIKMVKQVPHFYIILAFMTNKIELMMYYISVTYLTVLTSNTVSLLSLFIQPLKDVIKI